MGISLRQYSFNEDTPLKLKNATHGSNWPVVYIINNTKEVYIGETTNASNRTKQHLTNEDRKRLKKITIIDDPKANKSSVLDLESFLIKHMSADELFTLQNGNGGLQNHNYYQRKEYEDNFEDIWNLLKSKNLVKNNLIDIRNSDLFIYSPYKTLTDEQHDVVNNILLQLLNDVKQKTQTTFFVHGGTGTGKTILGVYLVKLLSQIKGMQESEINETFLDEEMTSLLLSTPNMSDFKIGFVVPMDNLRATIKKVFKRIKGLNKSMVVSPHQVANSEDNYDLLIVDESHRLKRRKGITQYGTYDQNNQNLELDKDATQLDWILKKSKYQIFFYDEEQTVKPADVPKTHFDKLFEKENCHRYYLQTQLRCLAGGNAYINFVKTLFSDVEPEGNYTSDFYDLAIFDDVDKMIQTIKSKNSKFGLCRTVAGYAWAWKTKGKSLPLHVKDEHLQESLDNGIYDIEIEGNKYIWNSKATDWINSANSVNEIGSIHTVQGFDLNYAGVIIGNELRYDNENHKLIVERDNYFDRNGKNSTNDKELLQYVLNIYKVLMTRGTKGTYVYVCDPELRSYFKKFIKTYSLNDTEGEE